jgi:hypothetical protein
MKKTKEASLNNGDNKLIVESNVESELLRKQGFFSYGEKYEYDADTQKQIKDIFEKHYETLFDTLEKCSPEKAKKTRSKYEEVINELSTMTDDQLKELNEFLQDEPELLLRMKNMPLKVPR